MLKHRSLCATAATFALILIAGTAKADVSGAWKLTSSGTEACTLTLAADGSATGCERIAKWKERGTNIVLLRSNGDVIAVMKQKGDIYTGQQIITPTASLVLSH